MGFKKLFNLLEAAYIWITGIYYKKAQANWPKYYLSLCPYYFCIISINKSHRCGLGVLHYSLFMGYKGGVKDSSLLLVS